MKNATTVDFATMQTAAGFPQVKEMPTSFIFEEYEVAVLQKLANRVAEIAALPIQEKKAKLWTQHNDLKTKEPLIFIDPENGWNECIPATSLTCTDPLARVWEMHLLKQIYWFEVMKDDKVIEGYFNVPYSYADTGWGLAVLKDGGEGGGSYKVHQTLKDYPHDFPIVHYPEIMIDWQQSDQMLELAQEIFGNILTVRRKNDWWWTLGMTWDYINLRGLEDFLCDFIVEPEYIHKMMELLCQGQLDKLAFLEKNGLLSSNNGGAYVCSGGFGYTNDLPQPKDGEAVTCKEMWGFVESQETVSIDPQHYGEFIFPYHKRMADRFGLNGYGCCEPFEVRWEYVRQLPNLRRISVSPWANLAKTKEYLEDHYIASTKPMPTPLAQHTMDEASARKNIQDILSISSQCVVEIIMKDNNTLGKNPKNAARWVEIAREEIARL